MDVDVECSVDIARSREVVSAFAADPDTATRWYRNIATVQWLTEPPLAVGSRLAFVAHFLGRRLSYTYEVVELEPGRRLVMATRQGPFPMETTYAWEDSAAGGTRMTLRNRGRPRGMARVATPVLARAVGRANRADLRRLKAVLEPTAPGS